MKNPLDKACLCYGDFTCYLSGAVTAANKQRIEYHLCACCLCFEVFIDFFNRYLEQSDEPKARRGKTSIRAI